VNNVPDATVNSATGPEDFGSGPRGEVRRWATELNLAESQFRKWRDQSKLNWDRYRARDKRKNSYNSLYANTSIIFPAIYNTLPNPDIRRRWDKTDPIGKCVSSVLNRAISFNLDTTNFDRQIRMDVLDMLICARGLSRVRYVPNMVQVGDIEEEGEESDETNFEHEAQQGESFEELEWESAPIEHVQWDQYLHGPGKTWDSIPWLGFKHQLTRAELIDRFGEEIGKQVPLDSGLHPDEMKKYQDDQTFELFRTATVWEIWDKDERTVKWINTEYRHGPLKTEDDPYGFDNFFPCPEPLIAIVDSDIQSPPSLFEQYQEQADELDRISGRINRIVNAIKVRGLYDPAMGTQVPEIFRGEDNDLIPAAESIAMLREAGGIDKFIWFAPIEVMMKVVQGLYEAREQCKMVIYELSGISDIMRGSTDAQETLGAQALKVAFGKGRVSDMQRNVQRYVRDLLRLQAQVIGRKFEVETLREMTQEKYPTEAEYEAQIAPMKAQYQQQAMMAMMQGQQPPPPPQLPPKPITWEQIDEVLKSDQMRTYQIDIETDSTIAATQQEDLEQMTTSFAAVTDAITKIWPLVQQGVMPFEAAKEFVLSVCRKFKFGNRLEDTFEQMKPPQPAPDPNAGKAQAEMQKIQVKAQADVQMHTQKLQADAQAHQAELQADMQVEQMRAELEQQTEAWRQEVQARENAHQQELELQRDAAKQQFDMMMAEFKAQSDAAREDSRNQMQMIIAEMNNARAIEVAELSAGTTLAAAQISSANQASGSE
tara:strand:- start:4843 stop:7146 length:2304 start_codon:yes stop_codon:yes gene_type:complete